MTIAMPLLVTLVLTAGLVGSVTSAAKAGARATPQTPPSQTSSCTPKVIDGEIPSWASAGFTPRSFQMHYELGNAHRIVALLWKFPLLSPPAKQVANKILWVSHLGVNGSPLQIRAQRFVGSKRVGPIVQRTVQGGPGPSYLNLPAVGCWQLNLSWSGHVDQLDLQYLRP